MFSKPSRESLNVKRNIFDHKKINEEEQNIKANVGKIAQGL